MNVSSLNAIISYFKSGFPCLFHLLTGYYCPGCGGTRAFLSLLDGNLLSSFLYNPIVIYGVFLIIYIIIIKLLKRKIRRLFIYIGVIILIGNFFIKNILLLNGIDIINMADSLKNYLK